MSDTPQTDHEEFCSGGPGGYGLMMVVSAAFAQKLERERDEARPVLEAARYQAMIHGSKIAYREACYQTELAISSFDAARAAAKEEK